jgi:hypothetical protein
MSAITVQDAIVDILRSNAEIHAEFNKALTGTLTFSQTSEIVVGVGTAFEEELAEGMYIRATTSTIWYRIVSIEDDLSLTLTEVFNETTESGVVGYKSKIKKGLGRNFDYISDSIGIYVYLMLENLTADRLPHKSKDAQYPFLITILFYEPDEDLGEERKTNYSQMVRQALEVNQKLNNTVYKMDMGDTRHYIHPQIEGSYSLVIPITGSRRETVG